METGRLSNRPQIEPAAVAVGLLRATAPATPAAPASRALPEAPDTDATSAAPATPAAPSRETVERLVEQLQRKVQVERRSISFEINDDAGLTIVSVIDRETDEVIRQIPSEELVRLAEFFAETEEQRGAQTGGATGLLLSEQA